MLEGLRILVDLFDKNTAAGEAMKFLFESVFQPLIDQATNAAYVIEAFVLGFLIGMTKVYIALKPAIKAVSEFFGFKDTSLSDVLDLATKAGEYAAFIFVGFVATLLAVGAVIGAVVAGMVVFTVGLVKMVAGVIETGVAIVQGFIGAFTAVKDYLASLPEVLKAVGVNLMLGLANGITNGVAGVVSAMTGAVGSAIDAAKAKLGIASPSKVFAEIGGYTSEGFANGVDDGAGAAQDAMAAMVEPPPAGGMSAFSAGAQAASATADGAAAGSSSGGKAAPGKVINFNAPVYFGGAKATAAEVEDLAEAITKILEGDATSIAGESAA